MHRLMKMAFARAVILAALVFGTSAAESPETFTVNDLTFERPDSWKSVPVSSSMRKAQLEAPGAEGTEPAEVIFFYFGPSGAGGTQANIDRWFGQFQEPKEELNPKIDKVVIGETSVAYVRAQGTYLSGPPFGQKTPKPGYALLGAILEADGGAIYVKMTGPRPTIEKSEAAFRQMIASGLK